MARVPDPLTAHVVQLSNEKLCPRYGDVGICMRYSIYAAAGAAATDAFWSAESWPKNYQVWGRLDPDPAGGPVSLTSLLLRAPQPEWLLSRWFHERHGLDVGVTALDLYGGQCSVRNLANSLQSLVDAHAITCVVAVDAGIDSVLRGDEALLGTYGEDLLSLCAIGPLIDGVVATAASFIQSVYSQMRFNACRSGC